MRNSIMKTIEVAAAVIVDSFENTTAVFATERGYGEFKGQWEFPGGKINKRNSRRTYSKNQSG